MVDVAALSEVDVLAEGLDHRRPHRLEAEGHVERPDERLGEVGEDVLVGRELGDLALVAAAADGLTQPAAEAEARRPPWRRSRG